MEKIPIKITAEKFPQMETISMMINILIDSLVTIGVWRDFKVA
jgi:hypothetical protein